MAAPGGALLRRKLSRVELVARYRELRQRLEEFFLLSAQRDRAAHGKLAATEGQLFQKWLPEVRQWVHDLLVYDPHFPDRRQRLSQPELGTILSELVDLLGETQLAEQLVLAPGSDSERLTELLALMPVMETWALATRNVVDRIYAEEKDRDDYAHALARWIIDLPLNLTNYRGALERTGLRLRQSDAIRALKALQQHQRSLKEWLKSLNIDRRLQDLLASRLNPRDERFFPILASADHTQLTRIEERAAFYLWAYELFAELGHEVRWPLSAYIVAHIAGKLDEIPLVYGGKVSEALAVVLDNRGRAVLRVANQVIFDDVLSKLSKLLKNGVRTGPLRDEAATMWDAQTLAEEQNLVQPLYNTGQSDSLAEEETIEDLYDLAAQGYFATAVLEAEDLTGNFIIKAGKIEAGGYHQGGNAPAFTGGLEAFQNPRGRWDYGILLSRQFSTLEVEAPPPRFPEVDAAYTNGSRFRELNVRPYLHFLYALLDDPSSDADDVIEVLKKLSQRELAELRGDAARIAQLRKFDDPAIEEFLGENRPAE